MVGKILENILENTYKNKNKSGTLFICATPIGNLGDVSFRLLETLKLVDIILAEDTRTIRKLLSRYNISKSSGNIISYQDYSSEKKVEQIYNRLIEGKNIALVSESGIPAIQDPGYKIINSFINKNIHMMVIPGPNAALSALVLSGLPTDNFLFVGFLPKTSSKRSAKISELAFLPYTLIFYESPLRIGNLIQELLKKLGDRKACLAREITKIYEESIAGNLSEISDKLKVKRIKGEIVLVVDGYKKELIKNYSEKDIKNNFKSLLSRGKSKKEALKIIMSIYDIDRRTLYNISTKI
jgi:16S rRNA (cytidine1402-2'-O)-methyltransferase